MEIFTKKSIVQKIIIAIVIVILLNFTLPNISKAAIADEFGGILFTPIQMLLLGLGDGLMYIASFASGEVDGDNIITLSTEGQSTNMFLKTDINTFIFGKAYKNILKAIDHVIDLPEWMLPNKVDLPNFSVTPERMFANDIPLLDINIINPKTYYVTDENGNKVKDENGNFKIEETAAGSLQSVISSWYLALRNLAIIGMLCVLAYTGIRILISSTATDKAKYKENLKDWLIAMCLLFFMHYIMSFSITIVEELTDSLKANINIPVLEITNKYELTDDQKELLEAVGNEGIESKDKSKIKWPTDFTGVARFRAQLNYSNSENGTEYVASGGKAKMAYSIMYFVLVIYTLMFLWKYLKRLIYIIFLTVIAPLIALTYPIDKMNDGSAQGFNMWLKEYIYNLLLQPLHLILYSILIGSAINLANKYLIYPLAILGFMLPAENIMKKFFGFEKGGLGQSVMGSAVGGAMVMNAINIIANRSKGGTKKSASSGSNGEESKEKIRMENRGSNNGAVEEDKYLVDAVDGRYRNNELPQENGNTVAEQYDNPYMENTEDQEQLSPEEMAEQDPNYMYMHPELFEQDNKKPENISSQNDNIRTVEDDSEEGEKASNTSIRFKNDMEEQPKESAIKGPSNKKYSLKQKAGAVLPIAGKALKTAGKVAGKTALTAYGAAALGTIGVAAGLASDKYENVFTYGAAAAATGAGATSTIMNKASALPSAAYRKGQEIKDEYYRNLTSEDPSAYKEYMNKQADNAFKRDKAVQKQYKDAFGTKDMDNGKGKMAPAYKVAMEKAMKYREHGITNNDLIIKAMKVEGDGVSKDWDSDQRIAAAKYSEQISNPKDMEKLNSSLKERGVREENIKINDNLVKKIKDFRY